MPKWLLITNVSHIDYNAARVWAGYVTVDLDPHPATADICGRQIRAGTWGGLPTATWWVRDPKAKIDVVDRAGGQFIMLTHDAQMLNMDAGLELHAPGLVLIVVKNDLRQPMKVETVEQECYPFAEEIDRRLFPYVRGQAYPKTTYIRVPA